MDWTTEQKVRDAIRTGDGQALERAVKHAGRWLDYDELERFVEDLPGGYRHVSWRGIQIGTTTIADRYGIAEVKS